MSNEKYEVVYTASSKVVVDIGLHVPTGIMYDSKRYFGESSWTNWLRSGIWLTIDKWKELDDLCGAENKCEYLGIPYNVESSNRVLSRDDPVLMLRAKWLHGKCTNCGTERPTESKHYIISENECKYCHSCGAMMDEE